MGSNPISDFVFIPFLYILALALMQGKEYAKAERKRLYFYLGPSTAASSLSTLTINIKDLC